MERFINAIEQSVTTENWYSAISLALTMPDICGWLESPGEDSKKRYVAWFDRYLQDQYRVDPWIVENSYGMPPEEQVFLSGNDCYDLSCAYIHEGSDEILRQK